MDDEFKQRTLIALARAQNAPFITPDDISLLCWHCGVSVADLAGIKTHGYSFQEHKEIKG